MPKNTRVAYPYATALYQSAKQSGNVQCWLNILESLAQIVSVSEFKPLLLNPTVSKEYIIQQITDILGKGNDAELLSFLNLLAANRRLDYIPEIALMFAQIFAEDEKIAKAICESPYPIKDNDKKYLEEKLSAKIGRKIDIEIVINPQLIGGVKITVDDRVIDASVLGSIKRMATQLLK